MVLISYAITGCEVYNLGTGKGTSVLEMVAAFEKASEKVLFPCLVFVFVYFELYLFVILGF